jgi:hypothetical protein
MMLCILMVCRGTMHTYATVNSMYTLSRIFTGIHNPCTELSKTITRGHRITINYSQKGRTL